MATISTWLNDELEIKFANEAMKYGKTKSKLLKFLIEDLVSKGNKNIVKDDGAIELIKNTKASVLLKERILGRLRMINKDIKQISERRPNSHSVDTAFIYELDEIKKLLEELKNDCKNF